MHKSWVQPLAPTKLDAIAYASYPRAGEGVQGPPLLHSKLQISLVYTRPCLAKKLNKQTKKHTYNHPLRKYYKNLIQRVTSTPLLCL